MKSKRIGLSEDEVQTVVMNWSKRQKFKGRPLFDYIHHSPNGGKRAAKIGSSGKRYSPEAAKFKRMGVKAGYPDLIIDIARGAYHGLRIEIKKDSNSYATPAQKERIEMLVKEGYCAVVAKGVDNVIEVIQQYIKLGNFDGVSQLAAEK